MLVSWTLCKHDSLTTENGCSNSTPPALPPIAHDDAWNRPGRRSGSLSRLFARLSVCGAVLIIPAAWPCPNPAPETGAETFSSRQRRELALKLCIAVWQSTWLSVCTCDLSVPCSNSSPLVGNYGARYTGERHRPTERARDLDTERPPTGQRGILYWARIPR